MRLDVANEVDPSLWRALRKVVKSKNTNSWILGEVWTDASEWLGGDQWDSAMNYDFRTACIEFFAKETMPPSMFAQKLMANYYRYAPQVSRNLFNLLSSHDTARFLTVCNQDLKKAHLAAVLQFSWVGVPSVYYGEELGMVGGEDPDNRRGMRWDLVVESNPTLQVYKGLIAARRSSSALQSGKPMILSTDDQNQTIAFARTTKADATVTVINRSNTTQEVEIDFSRTELQPLVGREVIDVLSGKKHTLRATRQKFALSGKQGIILATSKDSHYPGRRSTMLVHRFAPGFQSAFGLGLARSLN
jgi:glycosidase